jgi:hypothetical protein
MISRNLEEFCKRTKKYDPIVTPELYPKLVMFDKIVTSGFDYLDFKATADTALRLKPGGGDPADNIHRDWARWLEDYRTLIVGVGRQAATQAYTMLEMDPASTLVIMNNDPKPREIMVTNMAQMAGDGLRIYTAENLARAGLPDQTAKIKNVVIYTDSRHIGVERRVLIRTLVDHLADAATARILEICTA